MGKQTGVLDRVDALVRGALRQSGLGPGARIVAAVSGGPDSVALLHSLKRLRGETAFELHGAHLDHGLRGESSAADARFVAETFRGVGLPLTSGRADVESFRAQRRMSVEEAAREVRYDFLAGVAVERKADAVALGHTADDQAETVLMHVVRGSGIAGLVGMQPSGRREIGGAEVLLVRPLLAATRQDTLEYCRALGVSPRLDESNQSPLMTRNRVRMEVMPLLKELNPQVRSALLRLSGAAQEQVSHLDQQVDALRPDVMRVEGGEVALARRLAGKLPDPVKSHLLRKAIATVKGDIKGIHKTHLNRMARMLTGPASKTALLPGGLIFTIGYDEATLSAGAPSSIDLPPPLTRPHRLRVPGATAAEGWLVTARIEPAHSETSHAGELTARLSRALAGEPLSLRARAPGDRFQPLGMRGHKKLKDFFIDEKIPRTHRDHLPLLVSPRGVAWVAGRRVAEWAKTPPGDEDALHVRLKRDR